MYVGICTCMCMHINNDINCSTTNMISISISNFLDMIIKLLQK